MADADDHAVLDAEVGFDDAKQRIEDQRVGDDEVEALRIERRRGLPHAVADDLAAAEFDLVAVAATFSDQVALDLHEQFGVGEPNPVADGGAEHFGVLAAGKFEAHFEFGLRLAAREGVRAAGLPADFTSRRPLILPWSP